MILVLRKPVTEQQIATVCDHLEQMKLTSQVVRNESGVIVAVVEEVSAQALAKLGKIPGVEKALPLGAQHALVANETQRVIALKNGLQIGGSKAVIIAGPCSVEGRFQYLTAAKNAAAAGAQMLRGGAYKPRTSPYDFQGLGEDGLKILQEASVVTGLPVVSEVMAPHQVELVGKYIDVLQVGARNMYNYELLKELGSTSRPVLLKRGLSATISEWLSAAEYILLHGNRNVILCERGIRTFETHTRNTLDLSAVVAIKGLTGLPVIVDPSHACGKPSLIRPLSRAAIACGADGLIIEVHDSPSQALSDGEQAIDSNHLREIVKDVRKLELVFPKDPLDGNTTDVTLVTSESALGKVTVGGGCCNS